MSDKNSFVHLHAHTEYSLLDGACRVADDKGNPSDLLNYVAAQKMPALAMTDHGNMFGAIEFYGACQKAGIKPILGMEAYVAPGARTDRSGTLSASNNHLTLIAKNNTGYENLMKLTSLSYTEGFYYKPRIDWELLEKYHDGILALSGCLKGKAAESIMKNTADPVEVVGKYEELFGKGNYYLEIMDHGIEAQKMVDRELIALSKKTGIPLVATNDCHYFKKEDAFAHDVLLCIGTGKLISDTNRMKYATHEFYYKSPKEMAKVFGEVPEALSNTLAIAEKCNVDLKFNQILLPRYDVPEGETQDSYLEKLCLEGIRKRYGEMTPVLKNRLDEELSVIRRMGFSAYFLIVWDFVSFARRSSIPVGPGRGSGAGSLVSYALFITHIDPIKYGLLFERFLNPDRRSMPDLDIDFSDEGRERVIQYVREKYGDGSVAQIITFGSMLARLVVRDVGRVLNIPLTQTDKIAKMIPKELGITISQAMKSVPELKTLYKEDEKVKELIDVSLKLEGLKRHTGVHAAGIVIVPTTNEQDITHYLPLAKGSKDVITTQYNDEGLLKLGILKMDFLGLRTLSVLDHAVEWIRKRYKPDFDLETISIEDVATYKLLQEARTIGVFQLESSGMRDLLRKLKPTNLEDVVALISLYRPGPMGSGMLNDFVARKHDPSKIKYDHPLMEPILKDTYGTIVYQEQVMRLSRTIAGFTAGQADTLRKAMGKKIPEEIKKMEATFLEGAKKNNISDQLAQQIFKNIEHFGGYGFNKSHATAYGLVAYQTAYLKANFPHEYMAALISSVIGHSAVGKEEGSKIVEYISDAQSMQIETLPPSVQESDVAFSLEPGPTGKTHLRFGLMAIKNVGESAAIEVVRERKENGPFKNFEDFCRRVDTRVTNKKVMESLIKAGAFDSCAEDKPIALHRAQLFASIDAVTSAFAKVKEDRDIGQGSLFDAAPAKPDSKNNTEKNLLVSAPEWSEHEILSHEKEVLGFYFSGHPLAKFQDEIRFYSTCPLNEIPQTASRVRFAGIIENVRRLTSKQTKSPYARFKLEDLTGEIDCVVFPKAYAGAVQEQIQLNNMVVVSGRLNRATNSDDGVLELLVEDIVPLEKARENLVRSIVIELSTTALEEPFVQELRGFISQHQGMCPVQFVLKTPTHGNYVVETGLKVKLTAPFLDALKSRIGSNNWRLLARN